MDKNCYCCENQETKTNLTCSLCGKCFHYFCVDPPFDPVLTDELVEGFWTCSSCFSQHTTEPSQNKSIGNIIEHVSKQNPLEFWLPDNIKNSINSEDQINENKKRNFDQIRTCSSCLLDVPDDQLLCCEYCNKVFHLFCTDTPFLYLPEKWFCSEHDFSIPKKKRKINTDFNEKNVFKNDKTQETLLNLAQFQKKKLTKKQTDTLQKEQILFYQSMTDIQKDLKNEFKTKNDDDDEFKTNCKFDPQKYLEKLEQEQKELLKILVPNLRDADLSVLNKTNSLLQNLSPNFAQFLAWQTLMKNVKK